MASLVGDARSNRRSDRQRALSPRRRRYPDFTLPEDHPRLTWGHCAVGAVPLDLMPTPSLLRRLYEWQPLCALVEAILERGPIHRHADPFWALNLAEMKEGDELKWHFDQTDFVVSLAIQGSERDGAFEVVPCILSATEERYDEVALRPRA